MERNIMVGGMLALLVCLAGPVVAGEPAPKDLFNGTWVTPCQVQEKPRVFAASQNKLIMSDGLFNYSSIAFVDEGCGQELMKINEASGTYEVGPPVEREIKNKPARQIMFSPPDPFNGGYGELDDTIYGNVTGNELNLHISRFEAGMQLSETLEFARVK